MKVEFHPSTAGDVNEGASFYRRARPGLESEFQHEIDAAIDRIANSPLLFPLVVPSVRFDAVVFALPSFRMRSNQIG